MLFVNRIMTKPSTSQYVIFKKTLNLCYHSHSTLQHESKMTLRQKKPSFKKKKFYWQTSQTICNKKIT